MTGSPAGQDELTGLLDRRGLEAALIAADPAAPVAVAVVDVDGFRAVNETYGHAVGDQVLQQLAGRFAAVAAEARLARWGGDEFALLLIGPPAASRSRALAESVVDAARLPLTADGHELSVSVSVGVAQNVPAGVHVFGAAETALRAAQRTGRDRVMEYVHSLPSAGVDRCRLPTELRRGIEEGELRLQYQPILDMTSGRPVAVEALVRWAHPERGLLLPDAFLDIAETTGLVVPLGAWVVNEACRTAAAWGARGERSLRIAINLSSRQLVTPGLVDAVGSALRDSGCDGTQLAFEVSETAVLVDISPAAAVLKALRDLGAGLTIDHFGTNDSSLRYLTQLPVDSIKLDRTFVQGLATRREDTAIVGTLISLAHKLSLRCIAEGVETAEQRDRLEQLGCDLVQGYLFSRPVDAAIVESWLSLQLAGSVKVEPTARFSPATARIIALSEGGASPTTIAAALNAEGVPTASGARWSKQSVARVLGRTRSGRPSDHNA